MRRTKIGFLVLLAGVMIVLTSSTAIAFEFSAGGRTGHVLGYVTQGGSYGLYGAYDTEDGLNSALMNLFVESDYQISDSLKFYGSGMLTVDWIYEIKHDDTSWNEKLFDRSKSKLQVDDKDWQLLKEAHVTWTSPHAMLRVGKQIVSWGELLGTRIMDQINPLDNRRGFLDVEFEETVIPIWLIRAEYYPSRKPLWLQDLGFEFTYNPNAEFIPDQGIALGNDEGGIWSPNVNIPLPPNPFFPFSSARLGSGPSSIEKRDLWSDGNEFGLRIKANVHDALITLNYFYGYANTPVKKFAAGFPSFTFASDGIPLMHRAEEGFYPRQHFVGATFSRDITSLKPSLLGGVSPTLYWEGQYIFKNTFTFTDPLFGLQRFDESDEIKTGVELAWKINIPFLNPSTYFGIYPQLTWRRILDYPDQEIITSPQPLNKDNYTSTLMINTGYFHSKLIPAYIWIQDIRTHSFLHIYTLTYNPDAWWSYKLGAQFMGGSRTGEGFEVFDNKDQLFFKISYKWK